MTRLVTRSGRVGLTRIWIFLALPAPLSVSPMIQRTVSPAATGTDELLAVLQSDISDVSGRGIDLIECALGKRIDLHRIDVPGPDRLHTGRRIGEVNALLGIARLGCRAPAGERLQLAW